MSKAIVTVEIDLDDCGLLSDPIGKQEANWLVKECIPVGKRFNPEDGVFIHLNYIGDCFPVKVLKCVIAKEGKQS